QRRNFLATLLVSQGVLMLLAGDELGRTQGGNNNAYCQDNEISWVDWEGGDADLLGFTQLLIQLRRQHPVFSRRRWMHDERMWGTALTQAGWFNVDGNEMTEEDWRVGYAKSFGLVLNGNAIPAPNARGERIVDDSFCLLFNAHHEPLDFVLPP